MLIGGDLKHSLDREEALLNFSDIIIEGRSQPFPIPIPFTWALRARNWDAVEVLREHEVPIPEPDTLNEVVWRSVDDRVWSNIPLLSSLGADLKREVEARPIITHYVLRKQKRATQGDFEHNVGQLMEFGTEIIALYTGLRDGSRKAVLQRAHDASVDEAFVSIFIKHGAVAAGNGTLDESEES